MFNNPKFIELLMNELKKQGYDCKHEDGEIKVSKNGFPVTDILNSGEYRVYRNTPDNQELNNVRAIHDSLSEAFSQYEKGQPVNAQPQYHIMCEFGNYLMAAKLMNYGYMEFVTWQQDADKTRVDVGNYFTGYEAAKEDFSVRSGLVNRYKMLNETELKLIHQGLVHLGADYPHLTAEQMTNVGKLIEKVEMIVPAIKERSIYEALELVAEDGLEM